MTQICVKCKLDWNVSNFAEIPPGGYVCPPCRRVDEEKRKGDGNSGKAQGRRGRHMGGGR